MGEKKKPDAATVARISHAVGQHFRCFGGGRTDGAAFNPLVTWLEEAPLQFALGVNVQDVVRFVLEQAKR